MSNNRDDFTEATKRKMASRVGYICSKPDCNAFTIGASFEGNDKTSVTGVAAHICAAAPGGKRYDPSMTPEERKSIENGIWLCQTHAKLIDTDEVTYTVELLKEWKSLAEKNASQRLADGNYIRNYYNEHGNNFCALIAIMKNCVCEGDFNTLSFILSNYKSDLGETYNELILRYRIIYCAYCDRGNLQKHISEYIMFPNKDGVDELAELFISLNLVNYLKQIIEFVSNTELKNIAELVISNQLIDKLLVKSGENKKAPFKYNNANYIYKHLAYYIYFNHYFGIKDETRELYSLYNEEFFFECLYIAFEMARAVMKFTDNPINNYIEFIKNNLNKIQKLDVELQEILMDTVLKNLIEYKDEFDCLYNAISVELKSCKKIIEDFYFYQIFYQIPINEDNLIKVCNDNDNFSPLIQYVYSLDNDARINFLNKHAYLYEKSVEFIIIKYRTLKDDIKELIDKYRKLYSSAFSFVCIEVLEGNIERIEWLKSNLDSMNISGCSLYISVLDKYSMFDELVSLSNIINSNNALYNDLYRIGLILHCNSDTIRNALDIYRFLEDHGFLTQGLLVNRGLIELHFGRIENAKKCFIKEYENYKTENALLYLLNTRYEHDQCVNDKYLNAAKSYNDRADMLGIVGATLSKLHDENAYKYYLKSLLIDDSNDSCLNAIFFEVDRLVSDKKPEIVEENTVCFLSNNQGRIAVAIHEAQILDGIVPNNFANCKHCTSDDPQISDLMFRVIGEKINIFNNEYTLTKIEPLVNYISKVSFQSIMKHPSTIAFKGDIDESILKLTEYVKENSGALEKIVDDYNNSDVKLPLTSFSKMIGKSRLEALEFLYHQNQRRILNNRNMSITAIDKYVLSYEIIVIICKLNIVDKFPSSLCLCCTQQVEDQMLQDIDNELTRLSSKREKGSLVYHNKKLTMIDNDSDFKRHRHEFLTRLKKFLNSLNIICNSDYTTSDEMINQLFIDEKWLCEGTSLAVVKEYSNYCLVTDDQFVYNVAEFDGSQNIGLCLFLTLLDCDLVEFLDILLRLSKFNYAYYITPELYNRCVDLIKNSNNEQENSSKFRDFLITDRVNETPTEYHSQSVLNLFREIYQSDNNFFINNYFINGLIKYHFSLLNPKEYKNIIEGVCRRLFSISDDENGTT